MAENFTTPDVTPRVNSNDKAKRIRSDVFLNPVYGAGCNPSKTDADKTVEDDANVEPHPVKSGGQNPTNMPNVPLQASCREFAFLECPGIGIALTISAMLALAMVTVGTWLYLSNNVRDVQKQTQAVVDTNYSAVHPNVDTTYTPGHPNMGTAYTSVHNNLGTTYTSDHPVVDTTYTLDHPVMDTTYPSVHPAVDTTYTLRRPVVTASANMSSHPTILPLDQTVLDLEVSTNGVKAPAPSILKGPVAPTRNWRDDSRCGLRYPAGNGKPAECDPDGIYPCCSPGNWCGNSKYHCDCPACVDFRKEEPGWWKFLQTLESHLKQGNGTRAACFQCRRRPPS